MTEQQAILIFMTTQAALQAEDALLEAGLDIEVVPKPPGLQGLCGIALALWVSHLAAAEAVLSRQGVPFAVYDETMAQAFASRVTADIQTTTHVCEAPVASAAERVYTAESASSGRMPSVGHPDNRILTPAPAVRPGPHESEGGEPN